MYTVPGEAENSINLKNPQSCVALGELHAFLTQLSPPPDNRDNHPHGRQGAAEAAPWGDPGFLADT